MSTFAAGDTVYLDGNRRATFARYIQNGSVAIVQIGSDTFTAPAVSLRKAQ